MPRGNALRLALAACAALAIAPSTARAEQQLGLNVHQSATVGLDATKAATLRWVRIDLNWFQVEANEGQYDWSVIDAVVDGAKARGLEVLACIGYGPAWASTGDAKGDGSNNDVPKAGTYAAFVSAAVDRYKDRVTHFELWNEPNLDVFFEGTKKAYANDLLRPAAKAVHAACPACKVVAPALATVGGKWDVWLDAALAAAKDDIDVVSGHDYGSFPIDSPGAGTSSDSFFNRLESHRVLRIGDAVVYEGPRSLREVMIARGVDKPFWLTETGEEARYGDDAAEGRQTAYYRHVLEAMLSRPWWEVTIFYESFDTPDQQYTWGTVLADDAAPGGFREKPVMDLLRKVRAAEPAFGGTGAACGNGLDDDGDGLVDYPADPDCASAGGTSEGEPPPDAGAGGAAGAGGSSAGDGSGGLMPAGGVEEGAGPGASDGSGCGCAVAGSTSGAAAALGWIAIAAAAAAWISRRTRGRSDRSCDACGPRGSRARGRAPSPGSRSRRR
jgi:hypothetical protein